MMGCLLVSDFTSIRHQELGNPMKPEHIPHQDLGPLFSPHVIPPARTEVRHLAGTNSAPACFAYLLKFALEE